MAHVVASWCLQPDVNSVLYENSLFQVLGATSSIFLSVTPSAVYWGAGQGGRIIPR